jgi:hypothetical protein
MLVRCDGSTDYRAEFHATDNCWSIAAGPSDPPRVGVILNNGSWYLRVIDAAHNVSMAPTGVARINGQTCLMVFNFKFNDTGDIVDLYVNPPSIGGDPPAHPTCSTTNSGDVYFQSFSFYPGPVLNQGALDEIRLGDSFATVTPYTESGTLTAYQQWLQRFGLPTDGSADNVDSDGDGAVNREEYVADTNPTNAASVLKAGGEAGTTPPPGFVVRWTSASNRFYSVSRSSNLLDTSGGFSVLPGASHMALPPGPSAYTDQTVEVGPFFYRVSVTNN